MSHGERSGSDGFSSKTRNAKKSGGSLAAMVRTGELNDQITLKREFRARSLSVHPDTSGHDDGVFVSLKKDFDEAQRLLRIKRPHGSSNAGNGRDIKESRRRNESPFDEALFLELIRKANAIGLPSRKLSSLAQNQRLVAKIKKEAAKISDKMSIAMQLYFALHDRLDDMDFSSQRIKERLQGGLANFLDAHYNANPRSALGAISLFDEAQYLMGRSAGSVFSYMLPFVEWMRDKIAESKLLDH